MKNRQLFLRDDLIDAGLVRILQLIGSSGIFTSAYQAVAGKTWDDFGPAFPSRLAAATGSVPGVLDIGRSPQGSGNSYRLYGFPGETSVTVSITGPAGAGGSTRTINVNGCFIGTLGANWPSDSYTISAIGSNGTARGTVRK